MQVKATAKKVKAKKLKKKAIKVAPIKVTSQKGTYKIQVKVTAAGTSTGFPQYKAGSKTVWVTVKVK